MITMSFPDINSTSELLSIALAGEREAIRRYSELAKRMQEYGNDEAGTLFEGMIDEERVQEKQLTEWAELEGLTGRPLRLQAQSMNAPDDFDVVPM